MSSGMEECKISAWVRDKMFPSLELAWAIMLPAWARDKIFPSLELAWAIILPAWARDKMFPSLERLIRRNPVRVAESCIRSCYSVLAIV
jgi:hypothetical protein